MKKIIAVFSNEQVTLDYTKIVEKYGREENVTYPNDLFLHCKRGTISVESIHFKPAAYFSASIEIEFKENGRYESIESDILISTDSDNTEVVFCK